MYNSYFILVTVNLSSDLVTERQTNNYEYINEYTRFCFILKINLFS